MSNLSVLADIVHTASIHTNSVKGFTSPMGIGCNFRHSCRPGPSLRHKPGWIADHSAGLLWVWLDTFTCDKIFMVEHSGFPEHTFLRLKLQPCLAKLNNNLL